MKIKALIFVKTEKDKEKLIQASKKLFESNPNNTDDGLDFFISLHKNPNMIGVEPHLKEM